ncbi:hypothetical protein V5O48_009996 [Marasmius crinis-equi]|uniref:Uncharacterized protein n=1 Tax=Marasmius crinis-equi TaxID=585013 RepID=A0ABR3FA32_9AGAR
MSTPSLWTTFQLTYPERFLAVPKSGGDTDGSVPAAVGIRAWLSRAMDLPISLSIREDVNPQAGVAGGSDSLRDRTIMEISKVIGEFSARCTSLDLDVSPNAFRALCYDAAGEAERTFYLLRSLSIGTTRSAWTGWDAQTAHNLPFFNGSISLHSLSLSTSSLPVDLLQVAQNSLDSLTELNLTYRLGSGGTRPTPLLVFQILQRCLGLRVCRLTLGETNQPLGFWPQGERHRMNFLTELVVVDEFPRTTVSLMAALCLPSLERLSYTHSVGKYLDLPLNAAGRPLLPIQSLQLRRQNFHPSPLVRLTLRLTTDDEDEEPDITDAVSIYLASEGKSIRILEMTEASYETTLLFVRPYIPRTTLSGVQQPPPTILCPDLQTVIWDSSGEDTRMVILEMVRKRSHSNTDVYCPQLRQVDVVFWEDRPEEMDKVEKELRDMIQSGNNGLRICYRIYGWTRPGSDGGLTSREGVLISGSSS